jgi:SAM-dependent methyltransferase
VDWDLGRYEQIATDLLPAASAVIDEAAPRQGERAVDVGCGTGNAALLAAERGAQVTGVDPAERLLAVAREQATARGLDATFVAGTAGALPLEDGLADLVISVFGVIFAADAPAAAAEMARVTARRGRIVLSAWIPEGPISAAVRVGREALAAAIGEEAQAPPFAWHHLEALAGVFAPHRLSARVDEHELAFTAASAGEFVETQLRDHPAWVSTRAVLEPRGSFGEVRDRVREILEAANEEPAGFRVTSRYVVATMR